MRLLRRSQAGCFEIRKFATEGHIPSYAALSHTWQLDREEISFQDVAEHKYADKLGSLTKIRFCIEQAAQDGIEWVWIDTCCIDRRDQTELSESITSMYRWYRNATKCYAYLVDVTTGEESLDARHSISLWASQFENSRWFKRGWTLQELLAPVIVEFFSAEGALLGDKKSLERRIHEITNIPCAAIQGEPLANFTIPDRFTWAEHRSTTKKEDKAYALFGIFSVFLPPLYGEGDHAFIRLHNAIESKEGEKSRSEQFLEALPISSSAVFDSMQNQYDPVCLENTRVDLLNAIDKWVLDRHEPPIYWLHGLAGSGKSTVARTVARRYRQLGFLGGSFFFTRNGDHDNRAERLFTTLSSELARNVPESRRHICEAIAERRDIAQKGLRDQWEQLIIKPLSKVSEASRPHVILLVIDALDECKNLRDIEVVLQLFAKTPKLRELRLKIFLTGRSEAQIRSGIRAMPEASRHEFKLSEISADVIGEDLRRLFEAELAPVRHQVGLDPTWPGSEAIEHLVELSCGLFIWAKTACNYIREGRHATFRLKKLRNGDHSGSGPHRSLDLLYLTVLTEAFPLETYDEEERVVILQHLRTILGAIVTLKSSLSVQALAHLLNIEPEVIKETLADLHTILQIPDDDEKSIRLHHPTFRDFLLDQKRCTRADFSITESDAHTAIAHCCRQLMSRMLRWNICQLRWPSTSTEQITGDMIKLYLPVELQYACLMWAEHLQQSNIQLQDNDSTHFFLKTHFLHWIEALNIMGKGSEMTAILRIYQSLVLPATNPQQLPFVKDARDVMSSFRSKVKETPLQLYCAPLMYIAPSNRLRQHFWNEIHPQIQRFRVVPADNPEVKGYHYQNDISFTSDGRYIVYGSLDGRLRIWLAAARTEYASPEIHADQISSIAISPDGRSVASSSDDFTIKTFDLQSKAVQKTLGGHTGWINSVTFSPDGAFLVSGSMDGTIRFWNLLDGIEARRVRLDVGGINSVAFSPDGALLAVAAVLPAIEVFDVHNDKFKMRLEGHQSGVSSVRFSPDGGRILSGSDDTTIRLWDNKTGTEVKVLRGHDHKVCTAVFARTLPLIASGSEDKTIKLWSADSGDLLRTFRGHTSGICALAFSPDEATLAAVAFNDEVLFWSLSTGQQLGRLADSLDDEALVPTSSGGHGASRKEQRGHPNAVLCLSSTLDGSLVASGCRDGIVKVWSSSGDALNVLKGHRGAISSLMFSTTSRYLASASEDSSVRIWEVADGDVFQILRGHSAPTLGVCFTKNEELIATFSEDRTIKLWDVANGALLKSFEGHAGRINDIACMPSGGYFATCADDQTVRLWNAMTPQTDREDKALLLPHPGSVNGIAFSSDGTKLLSCSSDKTLRLWCTSDWSCTTLTGHHQSVTCGAFSSDDKQVASAATDREIIVWNVPAGTIKLRMTASFAPGTIAFSKCGKHLHTDRGSLKIAPDRSDGDTTTSAPPTRQSTPHSSTTMLVRPLSPLTVPQEKLTARAIFASKEWICYDKQRILWLPEDHSVRCVRICGRTSVLGHSSGSVTFLHP